VVKTKDRIWVAANEKGAFWSPSTMVDKLIIMILIFFNGDRTE